MDLQKLFFILGLEESAADTCEEWKGEKIPLLLFHAVMFAAVAYADEEVLKLHGYKDRRAAQNQFYGAARVSYINAYTSFMY